VLLLVALVQCGPVPGCYAGSKLYTSGEHFGFRIGMSLDSVKALAQRTYRPEPRDLEVGNIIGTVNDTSAWAYMRGGQQFEQLRLPRKQHVCWSKRNTVLRFRGGRLAAIIDELDITLP
jgi:hypothetical protein